jgi:16S rRNA (guanine527-N7)-methyltransferase
VKHAALLRRYCELIGASPVSLTSVPPDDVWARHVEDALTALAVIGDPPAALVDVGSGGGSPGIPLAVELECPVTLVESVARKARFLAGALAELGLAGEVVAERSEVYARGPGRDRHDLAVARALAPPPVAIELCLPLIRPGGRLVLWTGAPEPGPLAEAAELLGGRVGPVTAAGPGRALVVVEKTAPTPERFPRRAGMAGKRPLASLRSRP